MATPLFPADERDPNALAAQTPLFARNTGSSATAQTSLFPQQQQPETMTSTPAAALPEFYGSSEFTRGLRRGARQMVGETVAAGAQIAEGLGAEGTASQLFEQARSFLSPQPGSEARVPEWKNVRSMGDFGDYAAAKLGEFTPMVGAGLGAGVAGGVAGAGLRAAGLRSLSPQVAGYVAGAGALAPAEMGSAALTLQDDPEAMERTSPGGRTALTAAQGVVNSALFFAPQAVALRRALAPAIAERNFAKAAAEMGIGTAEGSVGFSGSAGAQELIRQGTHALANPERDTSRDMETLQEAMVSGAIAGAPGGFAAGATRAVRNALAPEQAAPQPREIPPGYMAGYKTAEALDRSATYIARKVAEWTRATDSTVRASTEWTDAKDASLQALLESPYGERLQALDDDKRMMVVAALHAYDEAPRLVSEDVHKALSDVFGADAGEVRDFLRGQQTLRSGQETFDVSAGPPADIFATDGSDLARGPLSSDDVPKEADSETLDSDGTLKELQPDLDMALDHTVLQRSLQNLFWYKDDIANRPAKDAKALDEWVKSGKKAENFPGSPRAHVMLRLRPDDPTFSLRRLVKSFKEFPQKDAKGAPDRVGPLSSDDIDAFINKKEGYVELPVRLFSLAKEIQRMISEPGREQLKDMVPPLREGQMGADDSRTGDLAMHALSTILSTGIKYKDSNGKEHLIHVDVERIKRNDKEGTEDIPDNIVLGAMTKADSKKEPYTRAAYGNQVRSFGKKSPEQLKTERQVVGDLDRLVKDKGSYQFSESLKNRLTQVSKARAEALAASKAEKTLAASEKFDALDREWKALRSTHYQLKRTRRELLWQRLQEKYPTLKDDEIEALAADKKYGVWELLDKEDRTALFEDSARKVTSDILASNEKNTVAREFDAYADALNDVASDRLGAGGEHVQLMEDMQRYLGEETLGEASPAVLKFLRDSGLKQFSAEELRKHPESYTFLRNMLDGMYTRTRENTWSGVFSVDEIGDLAGVHGLDKDVYGIGNNLPVDASKPPSRFDGPFADTKLTGQRDRGDLRVKSQYFGPEQRGRILRGFVQLQKRLSEQGKWRLLVETGPKNYRLGFFKKREDAQAFLDSLPEDGFGGLRIQYGRELLSLEQAGERFAADTPESGRVSIINPDTGQVLQINDAVYKDMPPRYAVALLRQFSQQFPRGKIKVENATPTITDAPPMPEQRRGENAADYEARVEAFKQTAKGETKPLTYKRLEKALEETAPREYAEKEGAPPFTALRQDVNPQRTLPGMGDVPARMPEGEPTKAPAEAGSPGQKKLDLGKEEPKPIEGEKFKPRSDLKRWNEGKTITDDFGNTIYPDRMGKSGKKWEGLRDTALDAEIAKDSGRPTRVYPDREALRDVLKKVAEKHGGVKWKVTGRDENVQYVQFNDGARVRYFKDERGYVMEGLMAFAGTAAISSGDKFVKGSAVEAVGIDVVNARAKDAQEKAKKAGLSDEWRSDLEALHDIAPRVDLAGNGDAARKIGEIVGQMIARAEEELKPKLKSGGKQEIRAALDVMDSIFLPLSRISDEALAEARATAARALGEKFDVMVRGYLPTEGPQSIKAGHGKDPVTGTESISLFTHALSLSKDANREVKIVAGHEVMHAVVTRIERKYGMEALKKLTDAVQAQHIRDQVLNSEPDPTVRKYYENNPEEMLVQAYGLWNAGELKLNPANILSRFFTEVKKTVMELFGKLSGDDLLANVFEAVNRGEFADNKRIGPERLDASVAARREAGLINYQRAGEIGEAPKATPQPTVTPPESGKTPPPAKPPEPPKGPPPGPEGGPPKPPEPPIDELAVKLRGIVEKIVGKEAVLFRENNPHGTKPGEVGWYVGRDTINDYTANMEALRRVREARRAALYAGEQEKARRLEAREQDLIKRTRVLSTIYIAPHLAEREAMGQTYHEALHAAFDLILTPQERATLGAAFTKGIVARKLKEIFAGQADVLKAMENPEEAAAYGFRVYSMAPEMLQFGRETKTIFDKVVKFFHDLFGIVTVEEKAKILMDNMLSGRRVEKGPDRVAEALEAHMSGPQKLQKLARTFGGLVKAGWDTVATSSYDRMVQTDNPALQQIADLFYTKQGTQKEQLGYINAYRASLNRHVNELDRILRDIDTEAFNAAYEARIMDKPLNTPEARKINEWFDKMRQYFVQAAGDPNAIGFERNYVPLVWDAEKVAKSRQAFVAMLEKPEYAAKMKELKVTPNELWERISNYVVRGEQLTDVMNRNTNEPTNQYARERSLDFIKREDRRAFMQDDHMASMLEYTKQMVRHAEFVRVAGTRGERLQKLMGEAQTKYGATWQQMKMAQDYIDGIMGDKGVGMSRAQKDLYGAMVVYQNFRLLPYSLFSSLVDPLGIAVRSNSLTDAGDAFLYNVKNIFRDLKSDRSYMTKDKWEKLAEDYGIIEDAGMSSNLSAMYDTLDIRGTNKKLQEAFFKYNLLNGWTRNTKIMAVKSAERFMIRLKEDFFGEHNARYLKELGLEKSDIVLDPAGDLVTTKEGMVAQGVSAAQAKEIEARIRDAFTKFVDQSVLNPNAGDLPAWGSNPYFAPIFHLKQYMFTFQSTILRRLLNEAKEGNYKPAYTATIFVPGMIAADAMRALVQNYGSMPDWQEDWDMLDYLQNGILRSGLLGTGALLADIKSDVMHGGTGFESLMGPSLEQLKQGIIAMEGGAEAKANWLVKAAPLQPMYRELLLQ